MKLTKLLLITLVAQSGLSYAKKEPKRSIQQILPAITKTNTVGSKSFNAENSTPTTLAHIGFQAKSSF